MINFRTTFQLPNGDTETNPSALACFYLRKGFALDLLATTPFHRTVLKYISLIKVFRLLGVKFILNKFSCALTPKLFIKIISLFLVIPTINHLLSCVWINSVNFEWIPPVRWNMPFLTVIETSIVTYCIAFYYSLLSFFNGEEIGPRNTKDYIIASLFKLII